MLCQPLVMIVNQLSLYSVVQVSSFDTKCFCYLLARGVEEIVV